MNSENIDELSRLCVIIVEHMTEAAKFAAQSVKIIADSFADLMDHYEVTSIDEMQQLIERIKENPDLLADYAEEPAEIDKPERPRPPKKIGPVNKANYAHNRPQRIARSCCHNKR